MSDYLRLAEAGKEIGLSRQRIWKLVSDGRIRITHKYGLPMISRAELNRFKKIKRVNGRPKADTRNKRRKK